MQILTHDISHATDKDVVDEFEGEATTSFLELPLVPPFLEEHIVPHCGWRG